MFVKICGLTTPEAVDQAVLAGADAVGFVLATSPRQVDLPTLRRLAERVPTDVIKVAVFREAPLALLPELVGVVDVIQADAPLPPLPEGLRGLPALADGPDLARRAADAGEWLLVDGPRGGGRGEPANWARVAVVAVGRRLVLAGGLRPENVAEAVSRVRPWGVDVSSGVERSPGDKDPARVAAFVAAARGGDR